MRWTPPREGVHVIGDSDRLQQIVWNLLSNAVKFTPDTGVVTLSLEAAGGMARLAVSDTGMGIDPPFMPYVFEPFRQADSALGRVHGGLGLGLALVRRLTELHGGRVTAESAGVGRGSTFVVELPLTISPARAADRAGSEDVPRLDGRRALIVDDDADGLEIVAAVLREAGATVTASRSVAEALAALRLEPMDVIVSDLAMPQEDGYELLRRVRRELESSVPAIALTAHVRLEDQVSALAAGFQMYLGKPVRPAALVRAVAKVTNGAEA